MYISELKEGKEAVQKEDKKVCESKQKVMGGSGEGEGGKGKKLQQGERYEYLSYWEHSLVFTCWRIAECRKCNDKVEFM